VLIITNNTTTHLWQVNASDVIIMEGILVFHEQRVRDMMNMKIFVDAGLLMFHFVYHFKLLSHLLQAKWVKTH
jgi:uridine kinase